jgi:hypothetical protein
MSDVVIEFDGRGNIFRSRLEHFHQCCSDALQALWGSGVFDFWLRFGSVTGFFKPAPSPKPRQKPKTFAPHSYIISVNALADAPKGLFELAAITARILTLYWAILGHTAPESRRLRTPNVRVLSVWRRDVPVSRLRDDGIAARISVFWPVSVFIASVLAHFTYMEKLTVMFSEEVIRWQPHKPQLSSKIRSKN